MNVLFLTSKNPFGEKPFGGGAETSCRLMAETMSASGHNVYYLAENVSSAEVEYGRERGVTLLGFDSLFPSRFSSARTSRLLALCSVIARQKIQIVYCFFEIRNVSLALQARRLFPRLRVVMRMAGLAWHNDILNRPSRKERYREAFASVDSVNFIHENLPQMVSEKLAELNMDVDFRDRFILDVGTKADASWSRSPGKANLPLKMVMASRFAAYHKRQDLLIDAVSQLGEGINISLTFVGSGARLDDLRRKVGELGLEEKISFVPFLPQEELWDLLSEADLLCHCADYEGLGKTIVESMSIGLPVLVSDVPPLNAYVQEGVTGFLAKNTPEKWARKITEISGNRAMLPTVSQAALAYAKTHFDHNARTRQYIREFERILGGQSTP